MSSGLGRVATHNLVIPPRLEREKVGQYPYTIVDSLNVGVSAGMLLHQIKKLIK